MGVMIDGVWQDQAYDTTKTGGRFIREDSAFRNWVTADGSPGPTGSGGFKAEPGRYHLYVSYACPWAHRTLILRAVKGLEQMIGVDVVHPHMAEEGWTFAGDYPGATGDTVNGRARLSEIYAQAKPDYTGRVTVPVLWDKERGTIVSNESAEIIRMLNSAFDRIGAKDGDTYPEELRAPIDEINERVYDRINNGVYKCGFATTQKAYEAAFAPLFEALDGIEERLGAASLSGGQSDDRGRLAAVHHAGPVRCGLLRALQVQPPAHYRLPEPVELPPRPLPAGRRGRNGPYGPHQAALLRLAPPDQPHRHRPAGACHQFRHAA